MKATIDLGGSGRRGPLALVIDQSLNSLGIIHECRMLASASTVNAGRRRGIKTRRGSYRTLCLCRLNGRILRRVYSAALSEMDIQNIARVASFTTKDGSEIRELLAYRNSCIRKQSLAEARLPPGACTTPHYHPQTEEIYYLLEGTGRMQIDEDVRDVQPGDAIAIPPGAVHTIENTGSGTLKFLCCCAPGYEDADTVLTGNAAV